MKLRILPEPQNEEKNEPDPYTQVEWKEDKLFFAENAAILGAPPILAARLREAAAAKAVNGGTVKKVEFMLTDGQADSPEAYRLEITAGAVSVRASGPRGLFYGGQTLLRLLAQRDFHPGRIYDAPLLRKRGFKCYLPSADQRGMNEFKSLIDFLARCKYNFVMIEIGGAMEFKKHPEINEGWFEYCRFMNEYSGKPRKIQDCMRWQKNSIHTTNGGGGVVPQEMVREMIAYCRANYMDVIPEMPSLSHCDYLMTRHRELAERAEDPFPDTACPNHPDYYPLLFDLFDEIIDVFRPEIMHIGHDEYYSIGLCERCRGKKAADIYAGDLAKCAAFLRSRGVGTMIWADKLLNAHFPNGEGCGGAEAPGRSATFEAIEQLPENLIAMHWYWSINRTLEQEFTRREIPVIFGNFAWRGIPEWKKRAAGKNILGACVSNWGATDMRTLQRNGLLFDAVSLAATSWNPALDSADYEQVRDWTFKELYEWNRSSGKGPFVEILHSCGVQQEYNYFFDGIFVDENADLLGWHLLRGEDGKTYKLPVVYGTNISAAEVKYDRRMPEREGYNCDCYDFDMRLFEVSFETLPVRDEHGAMAYLCSYPNPAPGQKLTYAGFEARPGRENVRVQARFIG